jgi:hypothetical protein
MLDERRQRLRAAPDGRVAGEAGGDEDDSDQEPRACVEVARTLMDRGNDEGRNSSPAHRSENVCGPTARARTSSTSPRRATGMTKRPTRRTRNNLACPSLEV